MNKKQWDVFISHASEDKEAIARPLAEALQKNGLKVWYDDFTLTIGDSLRRSIDHGLAETRYGIVILSPHFFAKEWTQRELDGLVTMEIGASKMILPIWHNVEREDVARFSPTLADRIAVSTSKGLDAVTQEILRVIQTKSVPKDFREEALPLNLTRDRPNVKEKNLPLFSLVYGWHDDILADHSLISKLQGAKDPVSEFLREHFSQETKALLMTYNKGCSFDDKFNILRGIIDDINILIQGPLIYDSERFSHVTLTEKTRNLLTQNPQGRELVLLNRWLIADTYFRELRKDQYSAKRDLFEVTTYMALLGIAMYFLLSVIVPIIKPSAVLIPETMIAWHVQLFLGIIFLLAGIWAFRILDAPPKDPVRGPRKVIAANLGGSMIGRPYKQVVRDASSVLRIVTEGLKKQQVSDTEWELRLFCGLFNCHESRLVVFDLHANEYLYENFFIPLAVIGNRPEVITLYQDNSILKGKRYEIPGNCYLPIELVFRITREFPGSMAYAFGLLADYHTGGDVNDGDLKKLRASSDDIYLFQCKDLYVEFNSIGNSWVEKEMRIQRGEKDRSGRGKLVTAYIEHSHLSGEIK